MFCKLSIGGSCLSSHRETSKGKRKWLSSLSVIDSNVIKAVKFGEGWRWWSACAPRDISPQSHLPTTLYLCSYTFSTFSREQPAIAEWSSSKIEMVVCATVHNGGLEPS